MYELELWELNACVRAFTKRQEERAKEEIALAWQTGRFTGAAFAGKLKDLKHYLKDDAVSAPKITREEFEKGLAEAEASEARRK